MKIFHSRNNISGECSIRVVKVTALLYRIASFLANQIACENKIMQYLILQSEKFMTLNSSQKFISRHNSVHVELESSVLAIAFTMN